ncbi:Protein W02A2.5, partial [Aphelenchoides avenae]
VLRAIANDIGVRIIPLVDDQPREKFDPGTNVNGTWVGSLGYVHNGSADTVCVLYQPTEERQEYFDFSDLLYEVPTVLMVKKVGGLLNDDDLWDFFDPFAKSMWVMTAMLFVLHCLLAILFARGSALRARQPTSAVRDVCL